MNRKKRKEKRFKKSKLESSVFRVPGRFISKDENGRYLPYCLMSYHSGVIKNEEICQERECRHYRKLYFPEHR